MSARPAPTWWIRAGARAYGPFASERLPGFVREGRLTPETSVARDEAGPWLPAGRAPSLDELFAVRAPAAPRVPVAQASVAQAPGAQAPVAQRPVATAPASAPAAAPAPVSVSATQAAAPAAASTFVVFAELLEGREALFSRALAQAGQAVRARPGLWLLRAAGDPATLRNALSQALSEGESLMVVEAPAAHAAWFNLGGEADRVLRGLWAS